MENGELSAKFAASGFVLPVRVLAPEEAAAALAQLDEYERWVTESGAQGGGLRGDSRFKLHLLLPWAAQLVRHPRLLDAVEAVLGTRDILVWSSDVVAKPAASGGYFSWHQDSTYARLAPPSKVVSAWIALTPSSAESGAVAFLPGSHQLGQLPHEEQPETTAVAQAAAATVGGLGATATATEHNMLSLGQVVCAEALRRAEEACGSKPCIGTLQPGEASLHSMLTVHRSRANCSTARRVGFVVRYMAAEVRKLVVAAVPAGGASADTEGGGEGEGGGGGGGGGASSPTVQAMTLRECATLVRGVDKYEHFELEPAPVAALDTAAVAAHAHAMERERANYFSGSTGQPAQYT